MADDQLAIDLGVRLPPGHSHIEQLAQVAAVDRGAEIAALSLELAQDFEESWVGRARRAQLPPDGNWRTWLNMAGRGFGKTRAGAEWVSERARDHGGARIALVAASLAEARAVMVEGESGLLAIAPDDDRPAFEPSLRRLTWRNGAQATLYSAGEPEALRGPQHHFAWCDEIGKWQRGIETWDNLAFGLRLGKMPRVLATTTPRPTPLVKRLEAASRDGSGWVAITTGRTSDNAAHLAPAFLALMDAQYGGTALGRQELDGALIEEIEGALWSRALIERCRARDMPAPTRVALGVDPPAGAGAASDACGIVVVAIGSDGAAYVLADASIQGASPERWARAVADAAAHWRVDRVVAEANNGGAMVESVLRAADAGLPVKLVHATHGKAARAEPVAALYEAGRAFHLGVFAALEDEMAGLILGGDYAGPGRSPDRADALVWAMTELMLGPRARQPAVRIF